MTAQQKNVIQTGVLITIIAAALVMLGAKAWDSKADKADMVEVRTIAIEHLCLDHPAHRRCQ